MARALLVAGMAAVVTVTLQYWLGNITIYQPAFRENRLALHQYIFENRPPPNATWDSIGANGTNVRIAAVYLAEAARRTFGVDVLRAYYVLDSVALFAALVLLYAYLRTWFEPSTAILGLLYTTTVLPLTYFLHYFHPWDRLSLLAWIVALLFVRADRYVLLLLWLPLAVAVKFDIAVLPALYWLVWVSRREWARVTSKALVLGVSGFGTYAVLQWLLPGGAEPRSIPLFVSHNVAELLRLHVRLPVLLAFAVPVGAAVIGYGAADRFARRSLLFGCALWLPLFLTTMFAEVRAHMPILVLVLPAALFGIARLLKENRSDCLAPAAVDA